MRIEPGQILRLVRRFWWLLLLGPLIAGAAAFSMSSRQPPQFSATTTLLISPRSGTESPGYDAILASQNLSETYSDLMSIDPVLSGVISDLGLSESVNDLKGKVSTSTEQSSLIIRVSVSDEDPQRAADIANAIGRNAGTYIASIGMPDIVVADPALVPSVPYAPRVSYSTLLGIILGLVVASGGVLLLDVLVLSAKTDLPDSALLSPILGSRRALSAAQHGKPPIEMPEAERDQ